MKNAKPVTPTVHTVPVSREIGLDVACMVINSIDPTANADPDTLINVRETATHKVIITHRGQKFSIPLGTLDAAAQATIQAGTTPPTPARKASAKRPANTSKKSTPKRPTTTH